MKLHFHSRVTILLAVALCAYGQQDNTASGLDSLLHAARQSQLSGDDAAAARDYKQALKLRPDLAQLWANLGLIQHEQKQYAEAIGSFQQAYRRDPSLFVPNLFLGMDLLEIGKASEAVTYLVKATHLNESDLQGHLALAHAYRAQGRIVFAASELEKVIEIDPHQSSAWFTLGLIYLDAVEADSRAMSEGYRESGFAKALYAESLVKQARYNEAMDVYKEVLAMSPKPPCTHSELGIVYLKQHDLERASAEFGADIGSGCGLAGIGQARLAVERRSYQDALAVVLRLWDRDHGFVRSGISTFAEGMQPDDSSAFADYLKQQRDGGRVPAELYGELAAVLIGAAVDDVAKPNLSDTTLSPGLTPRQAATQGRYGKCVRELKSREAHPSSLLAQCAFFTGDYALAAKTGAALVREAATAPEGLYWAIKANEQRSTQALNQYQQQQPDSERTHLLLGDIYRQRRRNDDAVGEYKRALEMAPGDPAALLGMATAYLLNGNYLATAETLRPALDRMPQDPEMNLVMGEALVERQQYSDAEPYVKKALNARPQVVSHVHALLGRIYANTNRPDNAIAELKLGLSSDEDGSLHYQLARLYRQAGDSKSAAVALDQMKSLQQKRRESAAIAVRDAHSSSLDDSR